MDSPLTRSVSIVDITQPTLEKIVHRFLSTMDPAGIIANIPGMDMMPGYGLAVALTIKPVQESIKGVIEDRKEERLHKHLENVSSVITALQQANYNTFIHVINSLDLVAIRTLGLAEETQDTNNFWNVAEDRLGVERAAIDDAVSTLERIGLITIKHRFSQADDTFGDYPDLEIAFNYTDTRRDELRKIIDREIDRVRDDLVELKIPREQLDLYLATAGVAVKKHEAIVELPRTKGWKVISKPQTTLSGFFFLELFKIEKASQQGAQTPPLE